MAKFITRTIASTTIVIGELKGGEVIPVAKMVEEGKIEHEKAVSIVQKAFKGQNVLVLDVAHDEAKYKISVEEFIANAEKVEVEEQEQTEIQYEDTDSVSA